MGVRVREKVKGSGEWWVFINHQGKRHSRIVGRDKKKALEVAEKIKAGLVLGKVGLGEKNTSKSPSFGEVAAMWLADPHPWKDSTRISYERNLEIHVIPTIGKIAIDQITPKSLNDLFKQLNKNGLDLSTLKLIMAPITQIFSYAVEDELISTNPVREISLRFEKRRYEIDPYDEREANRLLEQSRYFMDGKYYPVVLLALRTGIRIGEIQALQWSDIDFENRTIEVCRGWRKKLVSSPKNSKRRRVDMSPHLAETLKQLRTIQKKNALRDGKPLSVLVFAGTREAMLCRTTFQNALNRCAESAGLRHIRTHDLRHSYATIRLMRGHNIGDVSYQLGHSSIKITYDTYVHWIPSQFKSEIDGLDSPHSNAPQAHPSNPVSSFPQ